MQPGPRPRTRRKKAPINYIDAAAPVTPEEAPAFSSVEPALPDSTGSELFFEETIQPPFIDSSSIVIESDAEPTIVESTGVALEDFIPAPEPPGERTDFFFPPLPPREGTLEHQASGETTPPRARRQRQQAGQGGTDFLNGGRAALHSLGSGLGQFGQGSARGYRRFLHPGISKVWHWIVDDPYAPPRAAGEHALLQGRVLGTYRYHLYQRISMIALGGIPGLIAILYAINELITEFNFGFDSRLFLIQDLAGAATGFFGCLIFIRLATTRITLRSDGIEYKTMFRQIRSRWEEIGVLKVEYFRGSERWVVGSGRGAWAFLYVGVPQPKGKFVVVRAIRGAWGWITRSPLGLPKGRQLAKLITMYARLSSTGTPYWLPMVGRFTDQDPFGREPVTMEVSEEGFEAESEPEEATQSTPS